ncbi:hypothetical protein IC235_17965 [Hymenobacter sp. BT664]|uniref:Uncharacterized protein n=1 Tax=Hymenobacter montanus TaxID=2771359 RepID=A0A927GL33_9BACT|nr:hypothetical protein [Hymenobacter montanus]MBD2769779.1 hypothetical protein [Hymenobacter montanus]
MSARFNDSTVVVDTRGDTILTFSYRVRPGTLELNNPADKAAPYRQPLRKYAGNSFELPSLLGEKYPHHFIRTNP